MKLNRSCFLNVLILLFTQWGCITPVQVNTTLCKGNDLHFADILLDQMSECEYKAFGSHADEAHYSQCIKDITSNFNKIQADACRKFYLSSIRELFIANINHHAESLLVSDSSDASLKVLSLNPLNNYFKHLKTWIEVTRREIYSNPTHSKIISESSLHPGEILNPLGVLNQDVEVILSHFWTQVWKSVRSVENALEIGKELERKQSFTYGLPTLTQIIEAAIESEVEPSLAFPIFNQVLTHFNKRLQFYLDMRDFACLLKSCQGSGSAKSELLEAGRILSDLNQPFDAAHFPSRMDEIKINDPKIRNFLWSFFSSGEKSRKVLQAMYKQAHKLTLDVPVELVSTSSFSDLSLSSLHDNAVPFVVLVSDIWNRYHFSIEAGFLGNQGVPELPYGLTQHNIARVQSASSNFQAELSRANHELMTSREKIAEQMRVHNSDGIRKAQLETEFNQQLQYLLDLRSDLKGLQSGLASDQVDHYSKRAIEFFDTGKYKSVYSKLLQLRAKDDFKVSSKDGPQLDPSIHRPDISLISVNKVGIDVNQGDILNINVTGKWSPYCALKKSKYGTLSLPPSIGPEGYVIAGSLSESKITASGSFKNTRDFESKNHATSDSVFSGHNTSKEGASVNPAAMGAGAGAAIGTCILPGAGTVIGATAGGVVGGIVGCFIPRETKIDSTGNHHNVVDTQSNGSELSWGKNSSDTKTDESRASASFEMGLRLSGTPFEEMPAGSLLLVETPEESTRIEDIRESGIVRNNTVKIITQKSKLWFVVNDCPGEDSSSLSVQYSIQTPKEKEMREMVDAMRIALSKIGKETQKILKMGEMSSAQVSRIKAEIKSEVASAGFDLDQMPRNLFEIFEEWTSRELEQLDFKLRIQQAERKLRSVVLMADRQERELVKLKAGEAISALGELWALDNFDLVNLGDRVGRSVSFVKNEMLPLLKIRYPEVLKRLDPNGSGILQLKTIGLETSMIEIVRTLQTLFESINAELDRETRDARIQDHQDPVIMSFSKVKGDLSGFGNLDGFGYPHVAIQKARQPWVALMSYLGIFPPDPAQSWASYLASWVNPSGVQEEPVQVQEGIGIFQIDPNDLYVFDVKDGYQNFASGSLPCNANSPLIESMGVFVQLDSDFEEAQFERMNKQKKKIGIELVSDSIFPTYEGEQKYRFAGDWTKFQVPLFFGHDHPADYFEALRRDTVKAGEGVSPFGQFKADFRTTNLDKNQAIGRHIKEIQLIFKLNFRTYGDLRRVTADRCK